MLILRIRGRPCQKSVNPRGERATFWQTATEEGGREEEGSRKKSWHKFDSLTSRVVAPRDRSRKSKCFSNDFQVKRTCTHLGKCRSRIRKIILGQMRMHRGSGSERGFKGIWGIPEMPLSPLNCRPDLRPYSYAEEKGTDQFSSLGDFRRNLYCTPSVQSDQKNEFTYNCFAHLKRGWNKTFRKKFLFFLGREQGNFPRRPYKDPKSIYNAKVTWYKGNFL